MYTNRDHVLLNVLAKLNAGIELACNKVHGTRDGDNVQNDVGVGVGESSEPRQQHHHGSRS
jgi:hypothetical protein